MSQGKRLVAGSGEAGLTPTGGNDDTVILTLAILGAPERTFQDPAETPLLGGGYEAGLESPCVWGIGLFPNPWPGPAESSSCRTCTGPAQSGNPPPRLQISSPASASQSPSSPGLPLGPFSTPQGFSSHVPASALPPAARETGAPYSFIRECCAKMLGPLGFECPYRAPSKCSVSAS